MVTPTPLSPSSIRNPFRFKSSSTGKRSCFPPADHSFPHFPQPQIDPPGTNDGQRMNQRHELSRKRARRRRTSPALGGYIAEVDPEFDFRESLFDAMADDEGAKFWSEIYQIPRETFDYTHLEHMSEEEYASYVRTQMWQRSPEYLLLEKKREERDKVAAKLREEEELRAAQRRRKKVELKKREKEEIKSGWGKYREDWDDEVDTVIRKRAARKLDWQEGWQRYLHAWHDVGRSEDGPFGPGSDPFSSSMPQSLQFILPYPVLSGKREDITSDAVSEFLQNCPRSLIPDAPNRSLGKIPHARDPSPSSSAPHNLKKMRDVEAVLKAERLRWHPDKIQQRFGPIYVDGVDTESMELVTEVFRIVDALLGRIRAKLGDGGKTQGNMKDYPEGGGPYRFW